MIVFIDDKSGDFSRLEVGDCIVIDVSSDAISFERSGRTIRMQSSNGHFQLPIRNFRQAEQVAQFLAQLSEVEISLCATGSPVEAEQNNIYKFMVQKEYWDANDARR